MAITLDNGLGSNNFTGTRSSDVLTTANTVSNGAVIVVGIGIDANTTTVTSVTDSGGNTYALIGNTGNQPNVTYAVASAPAGLANGGTITVNYSTSNADTASIAACSFNGASTNQDGAYAGTTHAAATAWTTANLTTTVNGSLVLSACATQGDNGGNTPTSPAASAGTASNLATQYDILGMAGTVSRAGTLVNSVAQATAIFALTPSGVATGAFQFRAWRRERVTKRRSGLLVPDRSIWLPHPAMPVGA